MISYLGICFFLCSKSSMTFLPEKFPTPTRKRKVQINCHIYDYNDNNELFSQQTEYC